MNRPPNATICMWGALNEAVKWKWIISVHSDLWAQIRAHQQPPAPASCVFLISHCFSQREGHLLIDCLNPLQINTAGSLCDAYPSSAPPSQPQPIPPLLSFCVCSRPEGGRERKRLHQISPHFLTPALSWPPLLFHCLCFYGGICDNRGIKAERTGEIHSGQYPHHTLGLFMSCEINQGYLTSYSPTLVAFFNTFFFIIIILTAGGGRHSGYW